MSTTAFINFYAKTNKKDWFLISEATSNIVRDIIRWKEPDCSEKPDDFNIDLSYKYTEFCFCICKDDYKEKFGEIIKKEGYNCDCIIIKDKKLLKEIEKVKAPSTMILPEDVSHFIYVLEEKTGTHNGAFYRVENFEALLPSIKKILKKEKKLFKKLEKLRNSKEYYELPSDKQEDVLDDIGNSKTAIDEWKGDKRNIQRIINTFDYFKNEVWTHNGFVDDVIAYIYIE